MWCCDIKLTLDPVAPFEKPILSNLLEKYDYEFFQYDLRDVSPLGLFGYDWLDCYWTEPGRYAFFIRADGNLAGFAMVRGSCEAQTDNKRYNMSEFCILYKYRRQGVGRFAVRALLQRFPGRWELKLHPKNTVAAIFGLLLWERQPAAATPCWRTSRT